MGRIGFLLTLFMFLTAAVSYGAEYNGSIIKFRDEGPTVFNLFSAKTRLIMSGARTLATDPSLAVVNADPADLYTNPAVEYAVPNYVRHIMTTALGEPTDAPPAQPWGLAKIGVPKLWDKNIVGSKKILVAVIDTGIDYTHPALIDNVWTGPNGEHGHDFFNKDEDPMDDHSHGTHCSGTIGGQVVGINKQVSIMGVKFLSKDGSGDDAGAIESINYAVANGAMVLSNSWGGGEAEPALEESIKKACDAGVLFIAAAGNDYNNNDTKPSYPASFKLDCVVAVAATDSADKKANFSNYGAKTVHVAAPGVKVMSSVIGGKYAEYSGTSMATPHISGIAAMMLSEGIEAKDVKKILVDSSDKVAALAGKTISNGRVNAYSAVTGEAPRPDPTPEPSPSPAPPSNGIPMEELCKILELLGIPCPDLGSGVK